MIWGHVSKDSEVKVVQIWGGEKLHHPLQSPENSLQGVGDVQKIAGRQGLHPSW